MGTLKKIVILHGWTYSLDKWKNFTDLLKESGFEVYLPKRNFGIWTNMSNG